MIIGVGCYTKVDNSILFCSIVTKNKWLFAKTFLFENGLILISKITFTW